jgi:glycosyltransferase involved in cell wall biosynthesis
MALRVRGPEDSLARSANTRAPSPGVKVPAPVKTRAAASATPVKAKRKPSEPRAPKVSVVVPCFNEQEGLPVFAERMLRACKAAAGSSYEIIFVNDGSRDQTWSMIQALAEANPGIIGVNLARNHGHQLAVTAGMSIVRGEWILIIDADLQDPPEMLSDMMALAAEGYEVVYARRRARASETRFKLATAKAFYRLLGSLSEVDIPQDVGDFRLVSRRIADRLNAMPEQDRFIRGMVAWLGGRQTEILYDRDPRYAGETQYTLTKMVRLALAGLTGFSTAPLNLAIVLAFAGTAMGLAIVAYILIGYFFGYTTRGWSSLALITVFFGVGQFFCIAIIGAYLGRTYMQVKGRPLYMINEIVTSNSR